MDGAQAGNGDPINHNENVCVKWHYDCKEGVKSVNLHGTFAEAIIQHWLAYHQMQNAFLSYVS